MIELQEHRPEWADEFLRESGRVSSALGPRILQIEHIGSTAIPGLIAKPIIDLAARAAPEEDPLSFGSALGDIGYQQHRTGPKTHGVYLRGTSERRTHILHVFADAAWDTCNQRLFRDKLLRDPSAREAYGRLKASLAHAQDGHEYTAAKRSLIQTLLNEERAIRWLPPTVPWDK